MTQGLWNIGGFNLPDFGISEALGIGPNNGAVTGANNAFQIPVNVNQPSGNLQALVAGPMNPHPTANTSYAPTAGPVNPGNNAPVPQINNPQPQQQQPSDPYAQMRSDISGAWDNFLGGLQGNFGALDNSANSQRDVANSQYNQGLDTINTQKSKSLKDISNNIRNSFQAGNLYLGSRGAGDSSAANQYQFALTKEGNRQTSNLNEFVNTQTNSLSAQHDQQLSGIAQWLSQAQQAVRDQINSGQLQKAQDIKALNTNILNMALQAKQQLEQQSQTRYNALLQWAANNSSSMQGLQNNIAAIPQPIAAPTIDSTGNYQVPVGYGYGQTTDQNKNPLFPH